MPSAQAFRPRRADSICRHTTPSALANANELMKTAPLEDIRYYLAAQYIGAAASYLSDDFINASFDFP